MDKEYLNKQQRDYLAVTGQPVPAVPVKKWEPIRAYHRLVVVDGKLVLRFDPLAWLLFYWREWTVPAYKRVMYSIDQIEADPDWYTVQFRYNQRYPIRIADWLTRRAMKRERIIGEAEIKFDQEMGF